MALKTADRRTKAKRRSYDQPAFGLHSAGMLLTPEEFHAIEDNDERYRYELINGVLVVSPIPGPVERHPNELLGNWLWYFQQTHPNGKLVDLTLNQEYIHTKRGERIADRVIWVGLGRLPDVRKDPATIAVEFVSEGRRNRERDYVEKKKEYREAGVQQYWIIDRFERTMTVHDFRGKRTKTDVVKEDETYESPILPGFNLRLGELFAAADRFDK